MFVNVNPGGRQWRPNLIGYDAIKSFGSPSYYAVQMFARNRGDEILKATVTGAPLLDSVTRDPRSGSIFIKHVNPAATPQTLTIKVKGVRPLDPTAAVTVLAADPENTNSIDQPNRVSPVVRKRGGIKPSFEHTFPANSITVIRLKLQ